MSTTPNRMQAYWERVIPFLRREWPRLTDVDLEEIDGECDRLISRVKDLYNGNAEIMQEAKIKGRLQRFLNSLEEI